jgi:hypothetical protein
MCLPARKWVTLMPLDIELHTYEERREELERRFGGKYIVFHRREFIGPFDTLDSAGHAATRWHGQGPLLIRHVGVDELQKWSIKSPPKIATRK